MHILLAFVVLTLAGCTADESNTQPSHYRSLNFKPAKTNAQLLTITNDASSNMIRSYYDFDAAIAEGNTPLSKLSVGEVAIFRNGLAFRNNGIASIQYGAIKEILNEKDYVIVMALFGLDVQDGFWYGANSNNNRNNAENIDYKGYWCKMEHSCHEEAKSICTSNC